ncbi:hypothetical protein [Streptomyces sp. NPDC093149]|uniref:hypothetical protein n=1 Tax=Streptomyces sp. NPDC093149 TaxID=3366031 RepID=UPI00380FB76C
MRRTLFPALLSGALLLGVLGAATAAASTSTLPTTRAPATDSAGSLAHAWAASLSTRDRYVVDASGNRFKLKHANWQGAQGYWNGRGDINDPANHHDGEKSEQLTLGTLTGRAERAGRLPAHERT